VWKLPDLLFVFNTDTGTQNTISQLKPTKACHTLGVCIALDGNVQIELQYLMAVGCMGLTGKNVAIQDVAEQCYM